MKATLQDWNDGWKRPGPEQESSIIFPPHVYYYASPFSPLNKYGREKLHIEAGEYVRHFTNLIVIFML